MSPSENFRRNLKDSSAHKEDDGEDCTFESNQVTVHSMTPRGSEIWKQYGSSSAGLQEGNHGERRQERRTMRPARVKRCTSFTYRRNLLLATEWKLNYKGLK